MKLFLFLQIFAVAMALLVLLTLTLPLLSSGLPFIPEANNSNHSVVLTPEKPVKLFRDQESILDEKSNEIFRVNNRFIGSESMRSSHGDSFIPSGRSMYCRHKAKCEQLNNTTCLGVKLPYSSSTTDLVALSRELAMVRMLLPWNIHPCYSDEVEISGGSRGCLRKNFTPKGSC